MHGLSGVTHLPNLMELVLKNCGEKGSLIRILQGQVDAILDGLNSSLESRRCRQEQQLSNEDGGWRIVL